MKQSYPFENTNLPLEERVKDLVARFTQEEKVELMVQYQPAIERLGVKPYKHGTEAAHGVAWLGEATSFPQPIGLGCTWNPELMKEVGSVIGDEARVYYQRNPEVNGLTLWAPTVDMERDPRWGRTEEAYGEDPKLTGELTAALVQGIQGDHPFYFKAVATLKHFIGNNNEINRGSCSASIDPRNMKEYYQRAFEPAFVKGGAYSMMTSYNAVNGIPTILHEDVNKIVKGEWGMNGFIVSDAGDLIGIVDDHHYYDTYKEAVAHSIKAGIDSITDDKEKSCEAIREALSEGLLEESDLDHALTNTFRVRFRLGEFDAAELNPYANMPESTLCAPKHNTLSLQAARESIVLMKNDNNTLPLNKQKLDKVAVIGPLGNVVYRDWYSGTFPYKVTPFEAIKRKLEGKNVSFNSGNNSAVLKLASNKSPIGIGEDGILQAAPQGGGETFEVGDWGWGSFTLQSSSNGKFATSADDISIKATADEAFGWFVKEVLRLEAKDDGTTAMRTWNGQPVTVSEESSLKVAAEGIEEAHGEFIVDVTEDGLAEAIAAAREAETAILFVGNNPLINGKEDSDRPGQTLAESQERLVKEVFAVNPNTVVVVVGSYPLEINWIQENIPAVLYLSHAGQELGNAVADVLFGDYAPAGRLNMTWYRSAEQELTDIMDYDIRKGKRTYLYFDGAPLYPFGHGLTYTSFAYDKLEIIPSASGEPDEWTARIGITNTGATAGDEVVQLYVHADVSRVERPVKQLAGFARIHLQPGQSSLVELPITSSDLAIWDVTRDRFCVESGTYQFMTGSSSTDIRLTSSLAVQGETIPLRNLDSAAIRAENYDDYDNIIIDESKEAGTCVRLRDVVQEGWIRFSTVEWSSNPVSLEARVCGGIEGGTLSIVLGSKDNQPSGMISIKPSGEQEWETAITDLTGTSQASDVYIHLTGTAKLSGFKFNS